MSKGVNLLTGKVTGLKSHDYHIWIEQLLSVMVRGYLPEHDWRVLAELSHFFRTLYAKQICPLVIEKLHDLVPELLCKLEMIFPPGFFTLMLHLIVHLIVQPPQQHTMLMMFPLCITLYLGTMSMSPRMTPSLVSSNIPGARPVAQKDIC
jgi:hypothetical protein